MLCVAILIAASCTKPVLIGSDFLDDEKASLNFQDTFDLSFFTEEMDSVIVHSGSNISLQIDNYLLGEVHDPIFGTYKSQIFAQPILSTVALELRNSTLDSVVLTLKYDTLGNYGSLTDPVTLEVYRMLDNPEFNNKYYSDEVFLTDESQALGSLTFVPRPKDSVTVIGTDTLVLAPHIRVPLSTAQLADIVSQDSSVFSNQDSFLNYFKGINIRMTGATNTMIGINLLNSVSGITFYYDKGTSLDRQFKFVFTTGSVKTVYLEHDYTGSIAGAALSPEPETDYWFVQGLSGLTTRMTINDLSKIGPAIINQAELDVYCTFPDGDDPTLYPPIPFLVTQERNDTSFVNSVDVAVALARTSGAVSSTAYQTLYGGALEKVSTGPPAIYRYSMKVTAQVKDIFQGNKENIIYFNPFDKVNVPNRSVMIGPGHPVYAPRLRVYYTAL